MDGKRIGFLIGFLLICSVVYAQTYRMKYNSQTNKGDWVVDVFVDAPEQPDDDCTAGNMAYDDTYIYLCIAENTWERASVDTWEAVAEYLLLETGDYILLEDGTSKILLE